MRLAIRIALSEYLMFARNFLISSETSYLASRTINFYYLSCFSFPCSFKAFFSIFSVALIYFNLRSFSSYRARISCFSLSSLAFLSSSALNLAFFLNSSLNFSVSEVLDFISLSILDFYDFNVLRAL